MHSLKALIVLALVFVGCAADDPINAPVTILSDQTSEQPAQTEPTTNGTQSSPNAAAAANSGTSPSDTPTTPTASDDTATENIEPPSDPVDDPEVDTTTSRPLEDIPPEPSTDVTPPTTTSTTTTTTTLATDTPPTNTSSTTTTPPTTTSPTTTTTPPTTTTTTTLAVPTVSGADVYTFNCVVCHREGGSGKRLETSTLSEDEVRQVVVYGRIGTLMEGWGELLSDAEIDAVVTYVRQVLQAG